jgi:hypothetical protein
MYAASFLLDQQFSSERRAKPLSVSLWWYFYSHNHKEQTQFCVRVLYVYV